MPDLLKNVLNNPVISQITDLLDQGSFLVGGSLRDLQKGLVPADIDLVVFSNVWRTAQRIARSFGASAFWMDDARGMARIAPKGSSIKIDCAAPRGLTIDEDLSKRDITINAMAFDLGKQTLVDPLGGMRDLEEGRIRIISENSLVDDPLRILRCMRFALRFGFFIDRKSQGLLRSAGPLISEVSGERIRQEIIGALMLPDGADIFSLMDSYGLLTILFPDYVEMDQGRHHKWGLIEHVIRCAREVEGVLARSEQWLPGVGGYFAEQTEKGVSRGALLKLAAFVHDIGKPSSRSVDDKGDIHFYGHEKTGAVIAGSIMQKLRFAQASRRVVTGVTGQHMRVLGLCGQGSMMTTCSMYRLIRDTQGYLPEVLCLSLADVYATGTGVDQVERAVSKIWRYYTETFCAQARDPLVSGRDLIDCLGMEPGPKLGRCLKMVEEKRAQGLLHSRADALAFIRQQETDPS
ncbi:MAG: HD domain-containing protein [Thermodesulfobacteriota bacterium]|nr:HD domain-containing protein [Thermodesulfobacteriota bacterium]